MYTSIQDEFEISRRNGGILEKNSEEKKVANEQVICPDLNISFVWFDYLHPSRKIFSHVGTGLPGLNQY